MDKNLLLSKLRAHISSNGNTPVVPTQPVQISKPSKPSAKDILGLRGRTGKDKGKGPQLFSLEMEVDQYLSDPNTGTGIMNFWQV